MTRENLSGRIGELDQRIRDDLGAVLDYYHQTRFAWLHVERSVDGGLEIAASNPDTGAVIRGPELSRLGQVYVRGYLAESVLQSIVSLFEDFVFGLLRIWLIAHPLGIPNKEEKQVKLSMILDAADKEEILSGVVDRELDGLSYQRPAAWFKYLNDRVRLGCPAEDQIEQLTEIKASRDVLVHNRGIAASRAVASAAAAKAG